MTWPNSSACSWRAASADPIRSTGPSRSRTVSALFVRSLVGLDRGAAKEALAGFLSGKTLGANQIEFVNLLVDHLTEHGVMPAALLYESPFTDIN